MRLEKDKMMECPLKRCQQKCKDRNKDISYHGFTDKTTEHRV